MDSKYGSSIRLGHPNDNVIDFSGSEENFFQYIDKEGTRLYEQQRVVNDFEIKIAYCYELLKEGAPEAKVISAWEGMDIEEMKLYLEERGYELPKEEESTEEGENEEE